MKPIETSETPSNPTASNPPKRGRGRPRTSSLSKAERMEMWRQSNEARGGKTLQIHLGPVGWRALRLLSSPGERSDRISALLVQAAIDAGLDPYAVSAEASNQAAADPPGSETPRARGRRSSPARRGGAARSEASARD